MIGNFTHPWRNSWKNNVHVAILVTNCTVLLVTLLVGIGANLFVTYAVYRQKSLQTSTNALLVNLAVADLLRCVTDCPLLLVVVLNGNNTRDLGDLVCDGQVMSFSLSCCVQLFTLASISAERHQAIANPFKTAQQRKRVKIWIPLTWVVALVVSVLCVMFTKDSLVYVRCRALRWDALKTYGSFGRYVLLPVWFVCLALIVVFYSHIFILVKAHNRKIFDKGTSAPPNKKVPEDKKKVQEVVETKVTIVTEPMAPKEMYITQFKQEANGSGPDTKSCNTDLKDQKTLPTVAERQTLSMDLKTEETLQHPNQQSMILISKLHHNTTHLIDLENNGDKPGDPPNSEPDPPAATNQQILTLASKPHSHRTEFSNLKNYEGNPGDPPKDDEKLNSEQAATNQLILTHVSELHNQTTEPRDLKNGEESQSDPQKDDTKLNPEKVPQAGDGTQTASTDQTMGVMGEVCMMPSFANRDRANKKKEGKLAKRSGYIILTFLFFWMPLIGTIFLNPFLNRNQSWDFIQEVEVFVVSIACMTSLTNPIIYAAVNPQFRTEFYNLKARCKAVCSKS
ncbi:parietopsin [Clarias gariepinus]|uniref:parietopsin n=1 Tax=Clarias gariepinus TaxID=13013 RepID=UPI00234DAF29|nr:parietopsin [Clarias gariepinus]